MPRGQRLPHMTPKGRRRIRDLRGECVVGAGGVLPEVKAGKIRAPAVFACVGDVTEDAGEATYGIMWTATA
jgi:hypothetical protein